MNGERTKPMTRRDFVATSAAAGAAMAAAPAWAGMRPMRRSEELRVGLIGCGGRGTGAAMQAMMADSDSVLWAVGDAFEPAIAPSLGHVTDAVASQDAASVERKIQVDDSRRFVGFDAYKKVMASGVDVVILTTPPVFRPAMLRAAIESGKHVFCEKPVAVDGPGIRSVLESARLAREKNLSLMSGFCWRYQSQTRDAMKQVHDGMIGDVKAVYSTYNTTGWIQPKPRRPEWSDTEWQLRNWHYFTPLSGDHIVEQAVHAIDWIAWAHQDVPPARCTAVGGRMTRPDIPETGNVYDNFSVTYEYEDGSRGFHMCRHWPNTASDNSGYLMGTTGNMTFVPWTGNQHRIEGEHPWRCRTPPNDMYQQEHDELFAAIRTGARIDDGEMMAKSTLMAIMGRMAAYTGQVVTWEDALNSDVNLNPRPFAWGERPVPALAIPGQAEQG
jgi:predicted dehydrogenase